MLLQLDASALAACLDREALIDALDAAFRGSAVVPPRQHYAIKEAGARGGTLLVMPAWRAGASLGIKLVTVYPDNALKGLPAVAATYMLLDASTGVARALLDGEELTLRRTGAASALASRYLSNPGLRAWRWSARGSLRRISSKAMPGCGRFGRCEFGVGAANAHAPSLRPCTARSCASRPLRISKRQSAGPTS